jgi:two-component system chemotaxis response regulator CheY
LSYALLIDDSPEPRESLSRAARLAGFTLLTAESWDEGLSLFQVYAPTLVIADYQLPNSQHGIQLLSAIRRLSPSVRLILLSAFIQEDDVPEIEALGLVDRALPKGRPNVTAEIVEEIRAAHDRAAADTDWPAYARAHTQSNDVEQSEIDELDLRLKRIRGVE